MKLWYEETAMQGMPMPDGLDRIDQRMFLDLRALYWQLRNGVVDRDTAIQDKRRLVGSYQRAKDRDGLRQKLLDASVTLWKETEGARSEYRRERTLEHADKLAAAIDGIEVPR
ncbi:hypothetical protein [Lawsonibacter hominis]|uniref:Uncharacterized protein n=1 Tax=Lawsonibacter hominis TaxID=2763053 RepID=A0A8J6JHC3_9FIRM|nr:hypothetical protein [Lawsonibacter hominis]MBC5735264.1 hypothetical protein [Lawsonibacter hominis]